MSHLLILCEGETESRVLENFLKVYWQIRFQSVEIQPYSGSGELKMNFATDAKRQLKTEPDSSVLCLVDLYHEPFGLYLPRMTVTEGFNAVQTYMQESIEEKYRHRFGAFPVVMEIETWLLADEKAMEQAGGRPYLVPEEINHAAGELGKIYKAQRKSYGKVIDGQNLFSRASAQRIYEDNCPHFKKLIEWIITPPAPAPPIPSSLERKRKEWEQKLSNLQEGLDRAEKELEINSTDENLALCIRLESEINVHIENRRDIFIEE